MWCNKILVAYDGSAASKRALNMALGIIRPSEHIELVFVHVTRMAGVGTMTAGVDTVIANDAQDILEELELIANNIPNSVEIKLLVGTSPADLIVRCAREEGCDLIIMGSRGRGGVKGYLGSVSYAVTKESPIAVLIAKEDE
ncbi:MULTISPECIES: universal stress protein [unclassified Adlercreutzia]|uniref:universal stress protein n=1 Tax=unclassified Adlercreutzia TaxID=2636013 RepID=UPI0013ED2D20|nr:MULTISPECIES: universal stress protein [unclassified Adlercreutzia]